MFALLLSHALAAAPAAPAHLYLGAAVPLAGGGISSTGQNALLLDLAPVSLEWRLAPTWGLRLDGDANYLLSTGGNGWRGGSVRLSGMHYFGKAAATDGMKGFFLGPVAGAGFAEGVAPRPLVGAALGYSGALGAGLRWRTGLDGTVGFDGQTPTPELHVTLFEVGGFVF